MAKLALGALAASAALAASLVSAQFVPAPDDLRSKLGFANVSVHYKQVPPGICELRQNVTSYSGFAEVAPGSNIFFWFFEARTVDPAEAELAVWINGGPGSSSEIGLFQELGPCRVLPNGTLVDNPYAYTEVANMLFIDQPVSTGFSYADPTPGYISSAGNLITLPANECPGYAQALGTCGTYSSPNILTSPNSTQDAAENFYLTLQGFLGAFPQYRRDHFHFATESYGGHYGPVFSRYIQDQAAAPRDGHHPLDVKTLTIGNGWFDPVKQYEAFYLFAKDNFYFGTDLYNASALAQLENIVYGKGNCLDQIKQCYRIGTPETCSVADNFCANEVENFFDVVVGRDEYDSRELTPDPFPYEAYVDYLNTPHVQKALGVYTNFSESSVVVGNAFGSTGDDGRESGTVEDVQALLESGVYVSMLLGDADYNCGWYGGFGVANAINASGWDAAGFTNVSTDDGIVHGETRQAGSYAFTRVYYSGHEIPFYQPLLALTLFNRTIHGLALAHPDVSLASHKTYHTTGESYPSFREGNATVQWSVVDPAATYNTSTHAPNLPANQSSSTTDVSAPAGRRAPAVLLDTGFASVTEHESHQNTKKNNRKSLTPKLDKLLRKSFATRSYPPVVRMQHGRL